jgi:glycosyltransferase involved in cell wall biosynthesis
MSVVSKPAYRVLHVFGQLRRGGPAQALAGIVKHSDATKFCHMAISLLPADARACAQIVSEGAEVLASPTPVQLRRAVAHADILQVHFWNNPAIHAFMASDLPPVRSVVWCHINGLHIPQIISRSVIGFADKIVVTSRTTLQLPAFRTANSDQLDVISASADFSRLEGLTFEQHDEFNVGYIGRVHFAKLHPEFVRMCADVALPSARFIVCGDGGAHTELQRQAIALNMERHFVWEGYVTDVCPVLARLDVFGYPLCRDNSSTSELVLQEAMYAGVPPVVLPYGGAAELVRDGVTGLVAPSEAAYGAAVKALYRDPQLRRRLGENAAREVRAQFGADKTAAKFDALYGELMRRPKREKSPLHRVGLNDGASRLLESLDGQQDDLKIALTSKDDRALARAEDRIATSPEMLIDTILQYRFYFPSDPYLRLWTGLIMQQRGRPALAASEFVVSIRLGNTTKRVHAYLAESRRQAGGSRNAASGARDFDQREIDSAQGSI